MGVDPDPEALRVALAVGAVDRVAGSLEEAAEGAEAVVLAAPVPALEGLARRALAAAPDGCLVTDLGSAKAALLEALSPAERERFIGGHPVCGVERTGVAFARRRPLPRRDLVPHARRRGAPRAVRAPPRPGRLGRGAARWPSTLARTTA